MSGSFVTFVLEQLRGVGAVQCVPMFGGHGLYHDEIFFGIVHRGRLYLKTDEGSRGPYVEAGMGPFRPSSKQTLKNYWEVPADVLEDPEELGRWARAAIML